MTKTLGQVAFEAYYKGGGWQAAAEAVVAVTTAPNIVSGTVDTKTGNLRIHSPAELTARDKVIEAAKACAAEPDKTLGWTDLVAAVEALQEVE